MFNLFCQIILHYIIRLAASYGGIIFNSGRLLHSFQGIIADSQWCTMRLVNELFIIGDVNSIVQFSDGTSLPKSDTDFMLLQVSTDLLA